MNEEEMKAQVAELEKHTPQSAFNELQEAFKFVNNRFKQIDPTAESLSNFLTNDLSNLVNLIVWNIAMILNLGLSAQGIAVAASANAEKALQVAEGTINAEMLADAAEAVKEFRDSLVNSLSADHPLVENLDKTFAFLLEEFEDAEEEEEGELPQEV